MLQTGIIQYNQQQYQSNDKKLDEQQSREIIYLIEQIAKAKKENTKLKKALTDSHTKFIDDDESLTIKFTNKKKDTLPRKDTHQARTIFRYISDETFRQLLLDKPIKKRNLAKKLSKFHPHRIKIIIRVPINESSHE